jgi:hypothetical protein
VRLSADQDRLLETFGTLKIMSLDCLFQGLKEGLLSYRGPHVLSRDVGLHLQNLQEHPSED